jgi:hypothetical protein
MDKLQRDFGDENWQDVETPWTGTGVEEEEFGS